MLLRPRLSSAKWGSGRRAGLGTSWRSLSSRQRTRRWSSPWKVSSAIVWILFWPRSSSSTEVKPLNALPDSSSRKFFRSDRIVTVLSPSNVELVTLKILLFESLSSMSFFCWMKPLSGREMSWLWLRSTYRNWAQNPSAASTALKSEVIILPEGLKYAHIHENLCLAKYLPCLMLLF